MGKHRHARESSRRDAGIRGLRIEELFREELNSIIDCEVTDPRLEGTRISFVELSSDGSRARVWFSFTRSDLENQERRRAEVEAAFTRASGFFRGLLCDALPLKRMPDLSFRFDPVAALETSENISESTPS